MTSARLKYIVRIIVLWCLGLIGFHQLTLWSAPAHDEAAIFAGLLLTSFGVLAAQFAVMFVVVPMAVLRMLGRVIQGRKPMVLGARAPDPLDRLGHVVFVLGFTTLSAVVGGCAGLAAGGLGPFASALGFAGFGALLAWLVPTEIVFSIDDDNGGTVTDAQRADIDAARRAGEPVVLFTDRVVKGLREQLFEDQRKP